MYHQNLNGFSMLILWLQRVFKRADVSENHPQIFSQLWLCRCVVEQTPQGSPKALVEQKQLESIKNWQSHKFFTKNHMLVLAKRLRLSETWKHIKNILSCHFGDLKRKTHRSTSKSSNDKIFQKLIFSTFWLTTRRVCSEEEVRPLYTLLRWMIEKVAS